MSAHVSSSGAAAPPVWLWPKPRPATGLRIWLAVVAFALAQSMFLQAALRLPAGLLPVLFFVGGTSATVMLVVVQAAVLNAGDVSVAPMRWFLVHCAAFLLFWIGSAAIARALAGGLLALSGTSAPLPSFIEGLLSESQNALPLYVGLAALYASYRAAVGTRQLEIEAAEAERRAARSQLEAAMARIDVNATLDELQRVNALVCVDVVRAEIQLQQLADGLRARLARSAVDEPLPAAPELARLGLAGPRVRPWRWPRLRLRSVVTTLAVGLVTSLVFGVALSVVVPPSFVQTVYVGSLGRAVGVWLGVPFAIAASVNAPRPRDVGWRRFLSAHVLGFLAFGSVWVSTASLTRDAIEWLTGAEVVHVEWMWEWCLEIQRISLAYVLIAAYCAAVHVERERRETERQVRLIDARATGSRLEELNARLDPHFLFNALNTVSALMHDDRERASLVLSDLGELLRAVTRTSDVQWTLREECAHLEHFIGLLRARFSDRIVVIVEVAELTTDLRVPRFCLQTLVENAVKHNQDRRGALRVAVSTTREADQLIMCVADDGKGIAVEVAPQGGLKRLGEILALLHGPRAVLRWSGSTPRGVAVTIALPTA